MMVSYNTRLYKTTYVCTYFKMTFGVMVEKQSLGMTYAICYATGMLIGKYTYAAYNFQ